MRAFLLALVTIILFSCNSGQENKTSSNPPPVEARPVPDCNIALQFVDDYVHFILSPKKDIANSAWIEKNPSLTANFKLTYKNILDSAQKADPEMGLDFDPVLDAQDFPDKGFELVNCDSTVGYVTVRGKDWKDFLLTLKVVDKNNKWLVEGAGIINIPIDKRAKR